MVMKAISIVGARPQFIKAGPVSKRLRRSHEEIIIHTGQHYDYVMSKLFFKELGLPEPDFYLDVGSSSHAKQTGRMMELIEGIILERVPDFTIVYGDTNSTLAGALASAKVGVPVVHVEAGLRSYDRSMPEEINRLVADHLSEVLFCPTDVSRENLAKEGIENGVFVVGDVMFESLLSFAEVAEKRASIMSDLNLNPGSYIVATVHRAGNTDDEERLGEIAAAFRESGEKIIFPVHPRTRKALIDLELWELLEGADNVLLIDPVGYLDFITLQKNARLVATDSGGVQKEAYILGVPCITLRDTTEWVETVDEGWNILVGSDKEKIIKAVKGFSPSTERRSVYGDGSSSEKIVGILEEHFGK